MYKFLSILLTLLFLVVIGEAIYIFIMPNKNIPKSLRGIVNVATPTTNPNGQPRVQITGDPAVLAFEEQLKKEGAFLPVTYAGNYRIITYKFILTKPIETKKAQIQEFGKTVTADKIYFEYTSPAGVAHKTDFPIFGPVEVYETVDNQKKTLTLSDLQPGDTILVNVTTDLINHPLGSIDTKIEKQ